MTARTQTAPVSGVTLPSVGSGRGATRGARDPGDRVVVAMPSRDDATDAVGRGRVPSVVRERVLARLASSSAAVVVLSAPAGAGKSTLLRQWDDRDPRPQVGVRVSRALDDAAALAWRLIDVLEPLGAEASDSARTAVTRAEPRFSSVLLPTLTWLAASRATPYVLVVDDAHLLTDPGCQEVLAAVAAGVPSGSCLVLSLRTSTPAWLARVRAGGALLEIGPDELAFAPAEAARLLAGFGLDSGPAAVEEMLKATEGWAVGLYLSAFAAAQGVEPVSAVPTAQGHRFLEDYLRAEVLDALAPDVLTFVTRTAVLDELSGPLCDAVAGTTGGSARLQSLHRQLQLVVEVPGTPGTFRYHHLLAEAALEMLREREPDIEAELHRRAAAWYAEHDLLDAAIRQAKAAGDLSLTGSLVWSDLHANVGGGRPEHLRYRLAGLSDAQLSADRWLTLETCWLHLQAGDLDQATRWLLKSQAHVGRDWREQVRTDRYAAELAMPTGLIGSVGLEETVALCGEAIDVLPPDDPFRSGLMFLRGVALTLLRDLPGGVAELERAERYARALDVPIIVADSLAFRGVVALLSGDATAAARLIDGGTDAIRRNRLERLATAAHCVTAQALLQAMRGDSDAARTLAEARRLTALASGITVWFRVVGRLVQARAAALLGDGGTARLLLAEARDQMTPELRPSLVSDLLADTEAALHAVTVDGVSADSLTTAELRILQFLPSHLSFRQIGEHLFLSTNTVKTHAMSIYRKFGVSSRAEAVARAERLGLVEGTVRQARSRSG